MLIQLKTTLTQDEREFIKSAENLAINTRYGIEKAWWDSGKSIEGEFKRQTIAKDKSGRLYLLRRKGGKTAGRRIKHRASAPGQTPASRPPSVGGGEYRKGFDFIPRGEHELVIGDSAPHALYLETGTSRMKKRPGLGNAIKASERDIIRNLYREIEDAI